MQASPVREDFIELLRYVDELNFIFTIGSDLTILRREHVKELKKLRNLIGIQTTLDGASPESNDFTRGYGNFEKVMTGLELLQAGDIPFIVGTVIHKLNLSEVTKIGRLVGSLGAEGYCIAPLYPVGRGQKLQHIVPSNDELALANQEFSKLVRQGIVRSADPAWLEITDRLTTEEFRQIFNNQPYLVRQADRLLRIDPTGRCYTSIKLKEYLADSMYIGKITNTPLKSLWHEAPLLQILRKLKGEDGSYFGPVVDIRKVVNDIMVVN